MDYLADPRLPLVLRRRIANMALHHANVLVKAHIERNAIPAVISDGLSPAEEDAELVRRTLHGLVAEAAKLLA